MPEAWNDKSPLSEGSTPLHMQLSAIVRSKILNGVIQPGDTIPPEIDLGQWYGVSRTTVRRALQDLVQEGYLFRVPGRGTQVMRSRSPRFKAIALICPFLHWYMIDLIEGIERVIKPKGYELIIRNSEKNAITEARQIDEVIDINVAGIVLWPKAPEFNYEPSAAVKRLLTGEFPVVVVDQPADQIDYVTTDNFGGGYAIGRHFCSADITRVGFISDHHRMPASVASRWNGLQEAVRNHGSMLDESYLFRNWGHDEEFAEWIHALAPQALFCANDSTAFKVLNTLSRLGLEVPEHIAVAGYDDIPLSLYMRPPLTTVRQDIRAVGQSAARLLLQRITYPDAKPQNVVLPVQLVIRQSCGVSARRTEDAAPTA